MIEFREKLVKEVVDQIIKEFPDGFLGTSTSNSFDNDRETLETAAKAQFAALFVQITDNQNKNLSLVEGEAEKLNFKIAELNKKIEIAAEDPELKDFNELHNELIKVTTEKLMTDKMLEKIKPSLDTKKTETAQATPIIRKQEAPKGPAPLPPLKKVATPSPTETISAKPASPRTSKEIKAQPVLGRHRKSPPTPTSTTEPPLVNRASKPVAQTSASPGKPPKRPSAAPSGETQRRPAPTPRKADTTNPTWARSAEKMAASVKENQAKKQEPTPPIRRKSIEEAAQDLKSEKAAKAKEAAALRQGSGIKKG